jgi:beta-N-acetylhexosaminidase
VPSLDEERPSTLSKRIVTDILRRELNYDGVILSDDLEMKAIAAQYAVPAADEMAIASGSDAM